MCSQRYKEEQIETIKRMKLECQLLSPCDVGCEKYSRDDRDQEWVLQTGDLEEVL
jgi:hypothetical protein